MSNTACKNNDLPIRVSGLEEESIVDGPGFRFAIFVQGCPHHCPGCHNPQTHPFEGGTWMMQDELLQKIRENPLLSGVTFSGGEPFCQAQALAQLGQKVHAMEKNVVTYSGYTYEQLQEMAKTQSEIAALLAETDTLIDGPYIEAERDLELQFRGSRNQRIIHLKK